MKWVQTGEVLDPSITISQPFANADVPTFFFDVVFAVQNFDVAEMPGEPGDGYIKLYQDGNYFGDRYSTIFQFALGGWSLGAHTLTLELVDMDGNSLTPAVSATVNVNVVDNTIVTDIAQLRTGTIGQFYVLSAEALVTYNRNLRNQRFIQDATGGILIDDPNGIITDPILPSYGLTNLVGKLTEFHGVLQLEPSSYPPVTSTGNSYSTVHLLYSDVLTNWEDHESEVITLENGSFVGITPGELFVVNTNYTITDGVTNLTFRTNFSDADYIGTPIPIAFDRITKLIVGEFDGVPQVTAIELSDFVNPVLSTQDVNEDYFSVFPNPASDFINIKTNNNDEVFVTVFDMLGKSVLKQTTNNNKLNISKLVSGIYLLQINQNNSIITKKLIVE